MINKKPTVDVIEDASNGVKNKGSYILHDDYICYISPKGKLRLPTIISFTHKMNVINNETLISFTLSDADIDCQFLSNKRSAIIDIILFNVKTFSARTYKIRVKTYVPDFSYRTYLINGKLYLMFWDYDETQYNVFMRLVKIPDMIGFDLICADYIICTPRFLLIPCSKLKRFLILDSNDDSIWFYKYENRDDLIKFWYKTKRSLKRLGIIYGIDYYNVKKTGNKIVMQKVMDSYLLSCFNFYNYDILDKSKKFKEFTDFILQSKKECNLKWQPVGTTCKLLKIAS